MFNRRKMLSLTSAGVGGAAIYEAANRFGPTSLFAQNNAVDAKKIRGAHASSGWGVEPTICTRREAKSMTKSV